MEKKKIIAIIIGALLSVSIITASYFIAEARKNKNIRIHKEEMHNMIIDFSSVAKISFKEQYNLCKDKNGKQKLCNKRFYVVTDCEFDDDDNSNIYKNLGLKDYDLYEAIVMILDTAISNNVKFKEIKIITDTDTISSNDVSDYLKSNLKKQEKIPVNVVFDQNVERKNLTTDDVEKITYLVTFNSDGGTNVSSQTIEKGKKAVKPANPTKKGFEFVEWQFNGKGFDFNSEISQDITLEAMWKKQSNSVSNNNVVQEENVQETIVPEETPKVPENTDTPNVEQPPVEENTGSTEPSPTPEVSPSNPQENDDSSSGNSDDSNQ